MDPRHRAATTREGSPLRGDLLAILPQLTKGVAMEVGEQVAQVAEAGEEMAVRVGRGALLRAGRSTIDMICKNVMADLGG